MGYSTVLMVRNALAPGRWDQQSEPAPDEPTGTAADLPDEQIQDAIDEADSFIDSYIGSRYLVPATKADGTPGTPHPIDFWSRNIAAYNATLTNRESLDFTDNDPVARRYNATVVALTAVRDGKAPLPEVTPNSGGAGSVSAGTPHNPYIGDLFGSEDFSLAPVGSSWPRPFPWGPPYIGSWPW